MYICHPERECNWVGNGKCTRDNVYGENLEQYVFPFGTIEKTLKDLELKLSSNFLLEIKPIAEQVHSRLEFVYLQLVRLHKTPNDKEVQTFCGIIRSFTRYLRTPVSKLSVGRYARSRRVRDLNHVLHSEIDHLLDILNVPESESIRNWQPLFDQYTKQLYKDDHLSSCIGMSEGRNHQDAVTLVQFELGSILQEPSSQAEGSAEANKILNVTREEEIEDEVKDFDSIIRLIQFNTARPKSSRASENYLWFLPLHEVKFDEPTDCIRAGAFGSVYKGVWLDHPVVVKYMGCDGDYGTVDTAMFKHEVNIGYQLWHPHIILLYGTCHTGKRYLVCEYASNGNLPHFMKRNQGDDILQWRKLHEVALRLQYLHHHNIVHNDLKGDNIMVDSDGNAKLIDFDLSSIPNETEVMVNVKKMGGVHWKSPEYLAGGRPTFASDVYSFAMCILEAVTGEAPWGSTLSDTAVRFHVLKRRHIPPRPAGMNDTQWDLIERMTAHDPASRVKISYVIAKLQAIVDEQ